MSKRISKKVTLQNEVKIPTISVPFGEKHIPLYNFITDVSKTQNLPVHEIILAAIENYIWFVMHINNDEEFFVEKDVNGQRQRRKIQIKMEQQ
ncbi:MAG: hypothetical protein KC414_07815 [Romboutsia sp.]|nr:hypothetical protein [Romboutsia sp.]